MARRAARADDNHCQIVRALRAIGCTVQSLAAVGDGCPDLLVGSRGVNLLLEINDGDKPPSARRLTADQIEWQAKWLGTPVAVVSSVEAAIKEVTWWA